MPALVCSLLSWLGALLIVLLCATSEMTGNDGSPGAGFLLVIALALATVVLWLIGVIAGIAGLRRTARDPAPSRERSIAKGAVALAAVLAVGGVVLVGIATLRPHWLGL